MLESNLLLHSKKITTGHGLKSCLKRKIINKNHLSVNITLIKSIPGVHLLYSMNVKPHMEFFNPKPQDFAVRTEENFCKGCFASWDLAQIKEFQVQAVPQWLTAKSHLRKMKCTQADKSLLLEMPMKSWSVLPGIKPVWAEPGISVISQILAGFSPERRRWKIQVPVLFPFMEKITAGMKFEKRKNIRTKKKWL